MKKTVHEERNIHFRLPHRIEINRNDIAFRALVLTPGGFEHVAPPM
jgi:hypothetical protein